ncbi:unnamed protein product [Cladocopium goreaui]|uniref:Uncharacterized protein n=1 Tax=Cladocopium goreaui TaxID=2562237 RepID=A0A9P1D722_9DINO|nr:unnamed protein product [Cladocopium goreaui]
MASGIEPATVARLHFVAHRPSDLARVGLQCFMLQTTHEPRPSAFLRLALIDMEIFETQSLQPFALRRLAKWMPKTTNRRSIFKLMDLETQYQAHEERCFLWHNHVTIETTQTMPLQLEDGDYIQIHIGDKPPSLSCSSEIDSDASVSNDDNGQHFEQPQDSENTELFQTHLKSASKTWQTLAQHLRIDEYKTAPQHERPAPTRIAAQGDTRTADRPARNVRIHPEDQRYLERLFNENSLIECEEEGPIAYLETWYIHHQIARSCPHPKAVRLRHDTTDWIEDIVEPWMNEIDHNLDITIHVVRPQPPCTNMECVLAHLIVEQSFATEHTVGLLTIQEPLSHGIHLQHCAFSLPTLMNRAMVLRQVGLQEPCQQRLCSVRLGHIPFGLVDWDEIPRAACLVIQVPARSTTPPASAHHDRFDAVELMPVRLHADFRQWTAQLRSAWPDRSLPGAPSMIHVVSPPPPHLQAEIAAHVIIVQNPQDKLSTVLLTGYDSSITTIGPFMQMAITTHEHLVLDPVLMLIIIGLGGRCLLPNAPMTCTAWYNQHPVLLGQPFPIRDGYGIILQLSPRQAQQSTSGGTVLKMYRSQQKKDTEKPAPCERQTADTVAHDQRPHEGLDIFPAIGQKRLLDWSDPRGRTLVQVIHAYLEPNAVPPPTHLELNEIYSASDAEEELRLWGFHYRAFLCGEHDIVFAHPLEEHADAFIYVYCDTNTNTDEPVFTQHAKHALQEHQHMRFLYTKGFHKAVVLQQ